MEKALAQHFKCASVKKVASDAILLLPCPCANCGMDVEHRKISYKLIN